MPANSPPTAPIPCGPAKFNLKENGVVAASLALAWAPCLASADAGFDFAPKEKLNPTLALTAEATLTGAVLSLASGPAGSVGEKHGVWRPPLDHTAVTLI